MIVLRLILTPSALPAILGTMLRRVSIEAGLFDTTFDDHEPSNPCVPWQRHLAAYGYPSGFT